jgi:predicted nucleic acid-binding protein
LPAHHRTVRAQAQSLDLAVIATIGILLDARRDGHLPSLRRMLDQLIAIGFYLRREGVVYQELLRRAGEA